MTKILITGNPAVGLARAMNAIWPDATFASRTSGWDLIDDKTKQDLAELALGYDVFINNSALWKYHQTLLLKEVYTAAKIAGHPLRILCIGSTTDRTSKGNDWLYHHEKKALREYCNSLSLLGTWGGGPRVTLLSFGTLTNNQHKHPDRTCMNIDTAAAYVKWVLDQPSGLGINELSIDPIQEVADVK
jgi:hypothetical protein